MVGSSSSCLARSHSSSRRNRGLRQISLIAAVSSVGLGCMPLSTTTGVPRRRALHHEIHFLPSTRCWRLVRSVMAAAGGGAKRQKIVAIARAPATLVSHRCGAIVAVARASFDVAT